MHNISRNKRVRPLLWTRVLLRFTYRVDDGDAVAVGAGGMGRRSEAAKDGQES